MLRLIRCSAMATVSMSVPPRRAALLSWLSRSTLTPVRWLRSHSRSPVSIDRCARATSPAPLSSGTKDRMEPARPPAELAIPSSARVVLAPERCRLPSDLATPSMASLPSALAMIRSRADISAITVSLQNRGLDHP